MSQDFSHLVSSDFSVIDINTTIKTALERIANAKYTIITDRRKGAYYLHESHDILSTLNRAAAEVKVGPVIRDLNLTRANVITINKRLSGSDDRSVIIRNNVILGIYHSPGTALLNMQLREILSPAMVKALSQHETVKSDSKSTGRRKPGARSAKRPGTTGRWSKPLIFHRSGDAGFKGYVPDAPPFRGVAKPKGSGDKSLNPPVSENEASYYLNAHYPQQVEVEQEIALMVSIGELAKGTASSDAMDVKKGSDVEVVVSGKDNMKIIGQSNGTLRVGADKKLLFKLKFLKPGKSTFNIYAFVNGSQVGFIECELNVTVMENYVTDAAAGHSPLGKPAETSPDLNLLIRETREKEGVMLTFLIVTMKYQSDIYLKSITSDSAIESPEAYFQNFFSEIEKMCLDTKIERINSIGDLKDKGAELFMSVIPEKLRIKLWELRDKLTTVIINSEEPWIPWELCHLSGEENGKVVDGKFFCEQFAITRWIPGKNSPAATINFSNAALIVPRESDLLFAPKEKENLQHMLNEKQFKVNEVYASKEELRKNFKKGEYTLYHFSGHGAIAQPGLANNAQMVLDNNETFTPENINGEVRNLGLSKPFIFFNACQTGRSGKSLTGIGGWAKKFVDAGAAVFIGTYWNVHDELAYRFAVRLYQELLKGETVAKATQLARAAIKGDDGDPSWLAYTVYADPGATVSVNSKSSTSTAAH